MTASQNATVLGTAQDKHKSFSVLKCWVYSTVDIYITFVVFFFFLGSQLWWPNPNEWRIQHSWYVLGIILGWLFAGQMNKKRRCMMILVKVVLWMMTGIYPTSFGEVRLCVWNAAWSNIKQKKIFSLWHVLRKGVMIVFISHLRKEEMRVVVSSSELEQGALQKHNCRLSGINLQANPKQELQAYTSGNKSYTHPRIKQNRKCCSRGVLPT